MKFSNVCFCIMGYARPEYVKDRIKEINNYFPKSQIVVGIDKAKEDNKEIELLNQQLLITCQDLMEKKFILDFYINAENIGTKSNWYKLMSFGFRHADFCVYIEDDVSIAADFSEFLSTYINLIRNNLDTIAVLHSNYSHILQTQNLILRTMWPSAWGLIIHQKGFQKISSFNINDLEMTDDIVNSFFWSIKNSLLFKKVWNYKLSKNNISLTSWDTELMLKSWYLKFDIISPTISFTRDLGRDPTSISKKDPFKFNRRPHRLKLIKIVDSKVRLYSEISSIYCFNCERGRFVEQLSSSLISKLLQPYFNIFKAHIYRYLRLTSLRS